MEGVNEVAPIRHKRFSGLGTRSKQSLVLPCILCAQLDVGLHLGSVDAEGGSVKSKEDFRHKYHDPEDAAPGRAQQYLIEGYDDD